MASGGSGLGGTMSVTTSRLTVGDSVYQELLNAIYDGRLEPGQRLNDIALAEEIGISRTPVREAIQKLRAIGVVESEPNRFTPVAIVSPEQVRQHMTVWVALMHALLDEVVPTIPKSAVRQMDSQHRQFLRHLDELIRIGPGDAMLAERVEKSRELATANFDFFTSLATLSANPPLQASLETAQHVIRLGSLSLPEWVDVAGLSRVQADLLEAIKAGDLKTCHAVLDTLLQLAVPGAGGERSGD
jgi:GntR family transcriptional regulator, rspAB operon transcriptional repressor